MGRSIPYRFVLILILLILSVFISGAFSQSQNITVKGIVSDENNDPLPGVNIVIKNTQTGTVTDVNGFYNLQAPESGVLIFSFVGFQKQEISVGNQNTINVQLLPEVTTIPEVVVVGYGKQELAKVTGAAVSLQEKDFNQGIINSPEDLFQGKVAGVDVTKLSGEPGSESFIRIRGANTIRASNQPLIVVDGYPMDINNIDAPGTYNQMAYSPLNFINPDDIETIDFLKDASAAAIYGSRASNGVMLITTKSGKKQRSSLEYNMFISLSEIRKKVDVLSADEFRTGQLENGFDSTNIYSFDIDTDWQDEVFRQAWSQNHSLSFSGGTPKTNYRISVGYLDQKGIMETSYLKRYTGRTNIRHTGIDDRLTIDFNLTYGRIEHSQTNGGPAYFAMSWNPTFPVYDENGDFFNQPNNLNPFARLKLNENLSLTNKLLTNVLTGFEIIDGLSFKINLGAENSVSERNRNSKSEVPQWRRGIVGENSSNSLLFESFLDYDLNVGNSGFQFLAGYSWQQFEIKEYEFGSENFPTDLIRFTDALETGLRSIPPASLHEKSYLQSFFGRANYSLHNKYLVTVNYRLDGSSRFGENNKYGHFPSIGVGWRLSEENFLNGSDVLNNLKLRASWGINGNQEIPNKLSSLVLSSSIFTRALLDASGNPTNGYTFERTPNPDLKWEETWQWDIGIEFGLLASRFSGSLDYYNKKTTDLLYQTPASNAPTTLMWDNLDGEINNSGFELGLAGDIIQTNRFRWNSSFVFTTINNKIQGLPADELVGLVGGPGLSGTNLQILRNGEEIGSFYGPVHLGFGEDSLSIYKVDASGERVNEIMGRALPDYTWGFTNTFNYWNFDLSIFFNASQGNQIYDFKFNDGALLKPGFAYYGRNITPEQLASEESFFNENIYSSRFIKDGSYVRLNYITLGYSFDLSNVDWLSVLRIYVTGSNLHVWTKYTGYDPDVNSVNMGFNGIPTLGIDDSSYPRPRTYQIGLNVVF